MKKLLITLAAIFTLSLSLQIPAAAHETGEPHSEPSATTAQAESGGGSDASVQATEYSGEVLKVEQDKLTIDSSQGTKEFTVPSNVRIERNTGTVPLNQIKPGDKVTVKAAGDEAVSVSATAGSLIDKLIKAAIIALVILLLLYILRRIIQKRNRGFIKTTPTNLKEGE